MAPARGCAAHACAARPGPVGSMPRRAPQLPWRSLSIDLSLRVQQVTDLARDALVLRMADDAIQAARARDRNSDVGNDATRTRRHDDDAIAEKDRLRDRVRDEDDGLAAGLPDALQFEVHSLARQGIQRTERLVHQENFRIARQCPANAGALLHAPGQLVRIAVPE